MKTNILTVEKAKTLIGKEITTYYKGYKNQDGINTFFLGSVISQIEYYRNLKEDMYINHPKYNNRVEYWESYMTKEKLNELNNTFMLVTIDGENTGIYAHPINDGVFSCSDSDRFVTYEN